MHLYHTPDYPPRSGKTKANKKGEDDSSTDKDMQAFKVTWGQRGASEESANSDPEYQLVTFQDVMGNQDAKEELSDMVDYLKNPNKYEDMKLKIPKGNSSKAS